MIYLEYTFIVSPLQPGTEILIAELGMVGFESFVENEEGVQAYIQKSEWNENILDGIQVLSSSEFTITHTSKEIEQENWNAAWESNFNPIEVDDTCRVRAPFHESRDLKYEIVIEPKMSFGTGHHETTLMMLQFILENEFTGKRVLDMGCGTAVLAILAEMKGATAVDAIDIDQWCYENSIENAERNGSSAISVYVGGAELLAGKQYDIVIANINRNILLQDLPAYRNTLSEGGSIYLSGFYKDDLPIIIEACNKLGLEFVEKKSKNDWIASKFVT